MCAPDRGPAALSFIGVGFTRLLTHPQAALLGPGFCSNLLTTCLSLGDFPVLGLCWHLSGDSLALLSKDHFCLCFLETKEGLGTACGLQDGHA